MRMHGHVAALAAVTLALGAGLPAAASAKQATDVPGSTPSVVVDVAASGGFDWGDAGIGATGGLGISLIAAGGLAAASRRRGAGLPAR